jgi:hypothetical protein
MCRGPADSRLHPNYRDSIHVIKARLLNTTPRKVSCSYNCNCAYRYTECFEDNQTIKIYIEKTILFILGYNCLENVCEEST